MVKKMSEAIGIRLKDEFIRTIDSLSKDEAIDRSTMLRKLLTLGFSNFMKQKAKEKYVAGKITLSEAAKLASISVWEMQSYLVEHGYKSEYSIEDLEEDLQVLKRDAAY